MFYGISDDFIELQQSKNLIAKTHDCPYPCPYLALLESGNVE